MILPTRVCPSQTERCASERALFIAVLFNVLGIIANKFWRARLRAVFMREQQMPNCRKQPNRDGLRLIPSARETSTTLEM